MTADETVEAAVAWAAETCGIASTYAFMTGEKSQVLPDVMGELNERRQVWQDPEFPFEDIQQAMLDICTIELSFLVDNGDPRAAAALLRSYSDALGVAVRIDASLSDRVLAASPTLTFDFARPFVEYEDGTVGREMTMQISIAQLVEVD